MNNPKPTTKSYLELLQDIKKGFIKIPKFQREFIWNTEKTAALLDSILRGYPIGTFILWKTRDQMSFVKDLGGVKLPSTPKGDSVEYVLDGQQRLASLFVTIEGHMVQNSTSKKLQDYKEFYINLETDPDIDFEPIVTNKKPKEKSVRIFDLLNESMNWFVTNYDKKFISKLTDYQQRFKTYEFSTIVITDATIENAVEIFGRINTSGTKLTIFEIMTALTYDEKTGFDLVDKYDRIKNKVENRDFEIPNQYVVQIISAFVNKNCKPKDMLALRKNDIIPFWSEVERSIESTFDYFSAELKIPLGKLLPYPALIVPFAYFFHKNKKTPTANQSKFLQEYFWKSVFSERFNQAVISKYETDFKRMDDIVSNKKPTYPAEFRFVLTESDLLWLNFRLSKALIKGILAIFASLQPKSFKNNTSVILDNSQMSQSNSKNYHHFFPKAFLERKNIPNYNVISNITLISASDNQKDIRDKAPSKYMSEFAKNNPKLQQTMKRHLVGDLNDFGILNDDYQKFIAKRTKFIFDEIKKRVGQ